MNTMTMAPKVALKLHPIPKPTLYAGLTGELLTNTGMKDTLQINAIQQAVSEGLIEDVIVIARHPDGRNEKFTLKMKPFAANETVSLSLEAGKSLTESLDVGLAAAVHHAAETIRNKGLAPNFYVAWSARAKATPAVIAEAIKRLNLKIDPESPPPPESVAYDPTPPPPPPVPPRRFPQTVQTYTAPPPLPPGFVYVPVLTVTPAKDPSISFSYETSRRR